MTSSFVPEEADQHFVADVDDADDPSAQPRDGQEPAAAEVDQPTDDDDAD
jgi:hypothetical protein